jgi:hypothetical protein
MPRARLGSDPGQCQATGAPPGRGAHPHLGIERMWWVTPNALASRRRNGYGDGVAGVTFDLRPTRTLKADVTVMLERTRDELPAIQQIQRGLLKSALGSPILPAISLFC